MTNCSKHDSILAYAESRAETLFEQEHEIYECWLAEQPPAVDWREYPTPRNILTRDIEDSDPTEDGQAYRAEDMTQVTDATSWKWSRRDNSPAPRAATNVPDCGAIEGTPIEESKHMMPTPEGSDRALEQAQGTDETLINDHLTGVTSESISALDQNLDESYDRAVNTPYPTEDHACQLDAVNVSAIDEIAVGVGWAFLPDLTEITVTALDYTDPNDKNEDLDVDQQQRLVDMLKRHEIMIASGNALPPSAHGVVCDIDEQGHAPIKTMARRTPLRFLGKLYELLKGLLRTGLITFSDRPRTVPIVIVLKTNGVDIRLCICYKMVNAVTVNMAHTMPLVDDLLTDMNAYLWIYSLDAARGFWTILMPQRARKIFAFVCALGHFELLRMPFGLSNAPMLYQRTIDNVLWGFVQPKGGWSQSAKDTHDVEEHPNDARTIAAEDCNQQSEALPRSRTKFEADRESSTVMDAVSLLVNSPTGDMFCERQTGRTLVDSGVRLTILRRRYMFRDTGPTAPTCHRVSDQCQLHEEHIRAIHDRTLSHEVLSEGIRADPKKIKSLTEISFPTSKKGMQPFLGALNYYSRFTRYVAVYGAAVYQPKDAVLSRAGDLTVAKRNFTALQQRVIDAPILRYFNQNNELHIMRFTN
ncbi:Hypothetical protein PHPALM_12110 [Phytophthora palmivora]|uniref:Reverse transcriptase domain-containing protein n=1 Tax=Phytophthora palmivora TaxID=4796 RepID=A0A2P4Y0J2_9STRA|nr:Hypothetical protein PHPALM_12110 [Phytophthora palmivora]